MEKFCSVLIKLKLCMVVDYFDQIMTRHFCMYYEIIDASQVTETLTQNLFLDTFLMRSFKLCMIITLL